MQHFPIGQAMEKKLTLKMGNCSHRKYIPRPVRMVAAGEVDPTRILTHERPLSSAIEAFEHFDRRERGWVKVELEPTA
jgi:threonine dehydrogenase-like Zn-dependent dehydrogenase